MGTTIRNIPINRNLPAERCREMVRRVRTVRQGAVAEAWLEANRTLSPEERRQMIDDLTIMIRKAFQREIDEFD